MSHFYVRPAVSADRDTIVEFNVLLAAETEDKRLDRAILERGVEKLLADPLKGRYFVAEREDDGLIVGQLMHTREWSDWRDGDIWWLQSVYVREGFRRQGIFRLLFEHLAGEAKRDPHIVGLRLYVENDNVRAQQTYADLGLARTDYHVMERFFAELTPRIGGRDRR